MKPLAKSILISLVLTAAASVLLAAFHKKMFGSVNTTVITSNQEINHIMKVIKSLEEPSLLIKGVSEKIKNEVKRQKRGLLIILLGILVASLLGNLLRVKGAIRAGEGAIATTRRRGTIRPGENF